jgi:hypothetical protein
MFVQYVVGPERVDYSATVLLHLAIATLAGIAAVRSWSRATAAPLEPIAAGDGRRRAAWLLFLALFVVARYLPVLAGSVTASPIPVEYTAAPAFFWSIVLLDLGAVVPATVAAAVAVGLGRPQAGPAWVGVVSWFALVPASVAAMAAVMVVRDDPHASVPTLVVTTVASVAFAVPAVRACGRIVRRALLEG